MQTVMMMVQKLLHNLCVPSYQDNFFTRFFPRITERSRTQADVEIQTLILLRQISPHCCWNFPN